jgi:outer membrane protein assembly factor BamB
MAEWYRELLRVVRMRHVQVLGAVVGAAALLTFAAGGAPTPTYASGQPGRVAGAGLFATYQLTPTSYLPYVASENAPAPTPNPSPEPPAPPVPGDEWSQHGHNALRTSYTDQVVNTPWRWKWAWNGPNSSGGISSGKSGLPRNVQPVTGGGRVYVAAGSRGVYALSEVSGAQQWNARPGGNINSTVAYDKDTQSVFVVSSNGTLYKLNAANGNTAGQFSGGATSDLPLPPAIVGDRVFFSMGNRVFAVNKNTMQQAWAYDAGSAVHTPPAYSPSRDRVFVGSADLNVHAINNANGARAWRVRPVDSSLSAGQGSSDNFAEFRNGWPVIADAAGFVLIKARLNWQTMWTWNPWPTSNAQMRSNLTSQPNQQALFVMDMDDGARPFIANIGHGGYGDGGFMPMGPQPVVKRLSNGKDVVYTIIRGHGSNDGRWDSAFGEMMLDDTTVSGYRAGEVRFIRYEHPQGATTEGYLLTDEQPFVSMAGDYLFGGHWMAGLALQITDRSASRGAYSNPISSVNAPSIVTAQSPNAACGYSASHYCGGLVQDGDPRNFTSGFYIYYGQGKVYDQYWGEYASWVVSNGTVYFRSNDGAIVAFSGGNPQAAGGGSMADAALTPDQPSDTAASAQDVNVALTTIEYGAARAWAGKTASVEGRVQYVFNNGKQVLLGFENPHQGAFKILITKQQWAQFGGAPTNRYLVGDVLRVTGTIEWYQGDPVIYATDPGQIVNLDTGRSGRR